MTRKKNNNNKQNSNKQKSPDQTRQGPAIDAYKDGFHFIPLGGSEQFGVNFNMYGCDGAWLAIDCGIGFADERFPMIDILLPDPEFAVARKDKLVGLLITHAHEDHIGAVPYLWPRLKCPIYCTPFTAHVLRAKFDDHPECRRAQIIEIKPGDVLDLDPFKLRFIHVTHSIPHAVSTIVETKYGRVMHSGDWNLDPTPVLGPPTDEQAFKNLGKEGVLAYIGDSTNALVPGRAGTEKDVEAGLAKLFKEYHGRIAVTMFASNIARIQSIARAAAATDRSVCILGRSLHRMIGAARECGYLKNIPKFLQEDDLGYVPTEKQVLIVTGSQGEPVAALARLSRGEWPNVRLNKGDAVIFSSRAIPGNETEINAVKNNLSAAGVHVIDPDTAKHKIHVSGHPYRDEVIDMLNWTKPQAVIPVHGERLMLDAQADIARELQISNVIVPRNGSVIRLAPGAPQVIDHVPTGVLAVEPNRIVRADHKAIAERRKLQFGGIAHVTVALDERGDLLADPQVTLVGLIDDQNREEMKIVEDIRAELEDLILDLRDEGITDQTKIEEDIRITVRRFLNHVFGVKPKVSVHVMKI